jgi:hypothetical protein
VIRSHRFEIALAWISSAFALVAFSGAARAQNVACRKTETQAECHARLKCKPTEELDACKRRLLQCTANETLDDCEKRAAAANQGNNQNDPNNRGDDRRGDDRGDDRRGDDRNDDRRGDDRRGDDRNDDRRGDDRGRDDDRRRDNDRGRDRGGDDDRRSRRRRGRGRDGGGGGGGGGGGFVANKTFGLGLELGEPTGLTGKFFFSDKVALDFGLGWIYRHYYYGDGVHLYADILFHPVVLASADAFELPLYIGGGVRFWDFDYCDNRVCTYDGSAIGLRVPVGIAFDFNEAPIDIFIQLVPTLDFIRGDYYDRYNRRSHFGVDFSLGFRYWFK